MSKLLGALSEVESVHACMERVLLQQVEPFGDVCETVMNSFAHGTPLSLLECTDGVWDHITDAALYDGLAIGVE